MQTTGPRHNASCTLAQTVIAQDAPDAEGRLRAQVDVVTAKWIEAPPVDPLIVAGSTGSRGTTALLMKAVAPIAARRGGAAGVRFRHADAGVGPAFGPRRFRRTIRNIAFRALLQSLGLRAGRGAPWQERPALPRGKFGLWPCAPRRRPTNGCARARGG